MTVGDTGVVGSYRPEDEREVAPLAHSQRFDVALERALDAAAKKWGSGEYPVVTIGFEATVRVENPGHIDEYRVKMRQGG